MTNEPSEGGELDLQEVRRRVREMATTRVAQLRENRASLQSELDEVDKLIEEHQAADLSGVRETLKSDLAEAEKLIKKYDAQIARIANR